MTSADHDRFGPAQSIADAVLYEGYVLYPYRASSAKNQVRWQFGVLMPPARCRQDTSERSWARTECLVSADPDAEVSVRIRFLQRQRRLVEASVAGGGGSDHFEPVERLEVDGVTHVPWDEAVERRVDVGPMALGSILDGERGHPSEFEFDGGHEEEDLEGGGASLAGRVVRRRRPVSGCIAIRADRTASADGLYRVSVAVENTATLASGDPGRDGALGQALLALHAMVAVDRGRFVSLLDPPPGAEPAAAACRSDGLHPVLVGEDDVVLAAPIILYDHPVVAPESPGDLYDATEIDEILALRVLTLTEDEKREARGTDPRAAAIVDRCDAMTPEAWDRLHGTFRPVDGSAGTAGPSPLVQPAAAPWWDPGVDAQFDPWSDSVAVGGVGVAKGTPVRLRPGRRSDAQDLFYRGMCATVAGVFRDVDGTVQVAVTIDDDPATAELAWQGRYLFFHPDEIEPLGDHEGSR